MKWLMLMCACSQPTMIRVDGSSSVYPLLEKKAQAYAQSHPGVELAVGISGSAGGLKKLCRGEADIAATSMKADDACGAREIALGPDSITVIAHPSATFIDRLSRDELARIWAKESSVRLWSDLRPDWPDVPVRLYGASTQSHTYARFTEAVLGSPRSSRADYFGSENDYLVTYGVSEDPGGLGFVGAAYVTNGVRRVVAEVDLDRTLYVYVRHDAPPHVEAFVGSLR